MLSKNSVNTRERRGVGNRHNSTHYRDFRESYYIELAYAASGFELFDQRRSRMEGGCAWYEKGRWCICLIRGNDRTAVTRSVELLRRRDRLRPAAQL